VGVGFVPFRTLDCPAWDVWVTDPSGQPVSGVTVRLTYENYSAERQSHEIDATTDAQGHVLFSAQTLSASLGRRVVGTLFSARAGTHASFGPHAGVFVFGNGLEGSDIDKQRDVIVDWTGKPDHMESRIVVAPRKL
jgi:hypothetical protein